LWTTAASLCSGFLVCQGAAFVSGIRESAWNSPHASHRPLAPPSRPLGYRRSLIAAITAAYEVFCRLADEVPLKGSTLERAPTLDGLFESLVISGSV
jgi:hypothetical protein